MEAIAEALHGVPEEPETAYLRRLAARVNRVLEANRRLAEDLSAAHSWLRRLDACLRRNATDPMVKSREVRADVESLFRQFEADWKRRPAQAALHAEWSRLWKSWGPDLLHCYDIAGLPRDNLKLEAFFGQLRSHERRISGRKSTRPLRDFGQYQALMDADSREELLDQLRQVPPEEYQAHRLRLAEAEAPRQQLRRLHGNPVGTLRHLVGRHTARRAALASDTPLPDLHTI